MEVGGILVIMIDGLRWIGPTGPGEAEEEEEEEEEEDEEEDGGGANKAADAALLFGDCSD